MIDGFVERQQAYEKGDLLPAVINGGVLAHAASTHAGAGAPSVDEEECALYSSQLRLLSMRCCVLRNQLQDSTTEQARRTDRRAGRGGWLWVVGSGRVRGEDEGA